MFTASERFNWLHITGAFAVLFIVFSVSSCRNEAKQADNQNVHLKINQLVPKNNQAVFFVPNSYLEQLLTELIQSKTTELYDPRHFQIESLVHQKSSSTQKVFKLNLVKTQSFRLSARQKLKRNRDLAITAIYAPENMKETQISISKNKEQISITAIEQEGKQILLYQQDLQGLSVLLTDTHFSIAQNDLKSVSFHNNGLIANFSDRSPSFFNEIASHLATDFRYQNAGISVILPFTFISDVTKEAKIYFETNNRYIKGTHLSDMSIKNGPNNTIDATFELNNDDSPFFHEAIRGKCVLEAKRNKVLSMGNFTYSADNLSSTEREQMNLLVKVCRDSIAAHLVNKSLAPTFNKALINFSVNEKQMSKKVHSSTISYFKNQMIYRIDLRNE
jgi:hypothetical protein